MFHVKLITETRVYICHKNMKSMGFFSCLSNVFAENFIKNILQEMKNGLSLRQQQLQVIMLYIITWAFHKLSCRQNEWYFYFVLTLKDTEIFPKLLFLSDSWVTAPVFHNRFLFINLYLMTVVIHTKQRMWENRERERETTLLQWKLSRTQLYFIPRML